MNCKTTIADYDRCHLMQSARKKSHPTELYPTPSRTNIVSAREIGRQLEGRPKAVSQKHISGTAKRLEKIVCFPIETRLAASLAAQAGQAPSLRETKIKAGSRPDRTPVRDTREVSA